jgi:lipoprotein-releasing system permease protein
MNSTHRKLINTYAARLLRSERSGGSTLRPVIRIATIGVALGTLAMLLSTLIVRGFSESITEKVRGFVADYRITSLNLQEGYEEEPIAPDSALLLSLASVPGVAHLQAFAHKPALMKSGEEISGIVLRGISNDFDTAYFSQHVSSGRMPTLPDSGIGSEVLISKRMAESLKLQPGMPVWLYFIQDQRRIRKVHVSGVYSTGLGEEFDQLIVFCDINLIRKINNWSADQVGGYEIHAASGDQQRTSMALQKQAGLFFNVSSAEELFPQLFQWLELQDLNVTVILGLITLVAGITMLSTLLIIIMEHGREIGILQAIGGDERLIGRIFGRVVFFILARGLIVGNVLAGGVGLLQYMTGWMKLDEESYYLDRVPIHFDLAGWLLTDILILTIGLLMSWLATRIVAGIQTIRVLRFE